MGSKFSTFVEILLLAVFCVELASSDWTYKGSSATVDPTTEATIDVSTEGPSHWHELFPQACSGSLQSPINIKPEETIYNPRLREFAIWYDPPRADCKMFVKNNGHAVQIDTIGDLFVTNGGLPNVYKTSQFHFHWGHANHHGSEHHLDGQPHPLELHIVNFNYDLYGTIAEAATEPIGLAVLGVLFEIVDEDNKVLEPIIKAMEEVRDPDEENLVEIKPVSLRSLLPEDVSRYFRYNGSLTTPGCFESVVWTVFEQPQKISLDQLLEFRKVLKPRKHKHKNGKNKHRRHIKRSTAEKNAKAVLDEIGIRGNHMEEDELKADLMEKKAKEETSTAPMDEMTVDEHAEEVTTPGMDVNVELDEESAKRAEEKIARHINEKKAEDEKAHKKHMKLMKENEEHEDSEEKKTYVQDFLVNNFRPIQPVNDRLIQRSFKLRSTPTVLVGAEDTSSSPHYNVNVEGSVAPSTANGSSGQFTVPVMSLLITSVLSLLYIRS